MRCGVRRRWLHKSQAVCRPRAHAFGLKDAGLSLNFDSTHKSKTKFPVKGISAADAHTAAQRMLNANPSLEHLRPLLSPASFVVDGYIGLGVPIALMLLSSIL